MMNFFIDEISGAVRPSLLVGLGLGALTIQATLSRLHKGNKKEILYPLNVYGVAGLNALLIVVATILLTKGIARSFMALPQELQNQIFGGGGGGGVTTAGLGAIAIALTLMSGITIRFARDSMTDIQKARDEYLKEVARDRERRNYVEMLESAEFRISAAKLCAQTTSRMATASPFIHDNDKTWEEFHLLAELIPLFEVQNISEVLRVLALIARGDRLFKHLDESTIAYIEALPAAYPDNKDVHELVKKIRHRCMGKARST